MVFTVDIDGKSYKQHFGDIESLLNDQESTYYVLMNANDIPNELFFSTLRLLHDHIDKITYKPLRLITKPRQSE